MTAQDCTKVLEILKMEFIPETQHSFYFARNWFPTYGNSDNSLRRAWHLDIKFKYIPGKYCHA
jgi:hypothetical protein